MSDPQSTHAAALASAHPRPTGTRLLGLTVREVEVLRQVADGLRDREIAQRLMMSPRTVNSHLTAIYGQARHFLSQCGHPLCHRAPPRLTCQRSSRSPKDWFFNAYAGRCPGSVYHPQMQKYSFLGSLCSNVHAFDGT